MDPGGSALLHEDASKLVLNAKERDAICQQTQMPADQVSSSEIFMPGGQEPLEQRGGEYEGETAGRPIDAVGSRQGRSSICAPENTVQVDKTHEREEGNKLTAELRARSNEKESKKEHDICTKPKVVLKQRRSYVRRGSTDNCAKRQPQAIIEVDEALEALGVESKILTCEDKEITKNIDPAQLRSTDRSPPAHQSGPFVQPRTSDENPAVQHKQAQTVSDRPQGRRHKRRLSREEQKDERRRMQSLLREHQSAQDMMMRQEQERRQRLSHHQQHARRLRQALDDLDGESASRFVARAIHAAKSAWRNREVLLSVARDQATLGWGAVQGDPSMSKVATVFTVSAGISLFCLSWLILLFVLEGILIVLTSFVGFCLLVSTICLPLLVTVLVVVALLSGFVLLGMIANGAAGADNLRTNLN